MVISRWVGDRAPRSLALAPTSAGGSNAQLVPFAAGQVTMLDFWATWCGPCMASMERSAALQSRHPRALRVIPVTAIDDANSIESIRRAVRRNPGLAQLGTAIDDGVATSIAYRHASRDSALPRAFLVDGQGRLAWIGHPIDAEAVVEAMIAGRWNPDEETARRERLVEARRAGQEAMESLQRADALGDADARLGALRILAALPPNAGVLSPAHWPRSALVSQLAAMGRMDEARRELDAAAADARSRSDAAMIAGLATAAAEVEAAQADALAAEAERMIDAALAEARDDRGADAWTRFLRQGDRAEFAQAFADLAEIRRRAGQLDEARRLQKRAVELAEDLPDAVVDPMRRRLREDDEALRSAARRGRAEDAGAAATGAHPAPLSSTP